MDLWRVRDARKAGPVHQGRHEDAVDETNTDGLCYFVDDQTVAATDGTGTRSPAGIVEEVTSQGVWVRFDAALSRAALGAA
jgi:hypothetical protein